MLEKYEGVPGDAPVAAEVARVGGAFGQHEAAVRRHQYLLERLRVVRGATEQLRENMDRLRVHNIAAAEEMRGLRDAVHEFTCGLRDAGFATERMVEDASFGDQSGDFVRRATERVHALLESYHVA